MSAEPAALELQALDCVRGTRRLFSGVTADVRPGELLLVQGANGVGKTSLLRMLCGLATPAAGSVSWLGRPVTEQRDDGHAQPVYLGHAPALKDDLSALQNLRAAAGIAGWHCNDAALLSALSQVGLQHAARLPVRLLSQGQRKRAALARLLLPRLLAAHLLLAGDATVPSLWVLDEPFDALDADACDWLQQLILDQLQRGGVVVLTSHQPPPWRHAPRQVTLTLQAAPTTPLRRAGEESENAAEAVA